MPAPEVDRLTGGAGNGLFHAGGKWTMAGKGGDNEFVFSAPGSCTITDFPRLSRTRSSSKNQIVFGNSGFNLDLGGAGTKLKLLPATPFSSMPSAPS
jgi:hypothetical protein